MSILGKVSWIFYIIGTALVFCSWINAVSAQTGWIGWVIGMIGWGLGAAQNKAKAGAVAELQKLSSLHQSGELSDEEYAAAKQQLLN